MEKFGNNFVNFQKFRQLFEEEKFTDTILIASDTKRIIKCHRIVLIAASAYFEELFGLIDGPTTIVLRDISHEILIKVLEFIYCGETEVHADQISEFKKAASYLKISNFSSDAPRLKRNFEDELDVSLTTQMSQDTIVDEMIQDFSMNSSISINFEDEEIHSEEKEEKSISLAKSKNRDIEPQLKKAKIDTWTNKPERCKFCSRLIHEKNPIFHHQRHCFMNNCRVPLKCQQCQKDFEFVSNLREHNLKNHRDRR